MALMGGIMIRQEHWQCFLSQLDISIDLLGINSCLHLQNQYCNGDVMALMRGIIEAREAQTMLLGPAAIIDVLEIISYWWWHSWEASFLLEAVTHGSAISWYVIIIDFSHVCFLYLYNSKVCSEILHYQRVMDREIKRQIKGYSEE